jgi:hypothetical protein
MDIGNCVIKISVHQPQQFYTQEAIKILFGRAKWEPIHEHGIHRWIGPNDVRLQISFPTTFVKSYQGEFSDMMPHDNDPNKSFEICVQKECPLLYQGRIYKCSTSALLGKVLNDWGRTQVKEWQPYLKYKGIGPDCTDQELFDFLKGFGQAESICQMCPAEKDRSSRINHTATVLTKKDWIEIHGKN